jgi:hypothetical protein
MFAEERRAIKPATLTMRRNEYEEVNLCFNDGS